MNYVLPKVLHSLTSFYIPTYSLSIKFYARFSPLAICRVNEYCKGREKCFLSLREREKSAIKLGLLASGRGAYILGAAIHMSNRYKHFI